MYYSGTYLEGLKKITKDLSQDRRCLVRDLKRATPEIKYRPVLIQIDGNLFNYHQQKLCAINDLTHSWTLQKNLALECKILKHESIY
jgi:hypothetical protein